MRSAWRVCRRFEELKEFEERTVRLHDEENDWCGKKKTHFDQEDRKTQQQDLDEWPSPHGAQRNPPRDG